MTHITISEKRQNGLKPKENEKKLKKKKKGKGEKMTIFGFQDKNSNDEFFFQGSNRSALSGPLQTRYSPKLFLGAKTKVEIVAW